MRAQVNVFEAISLNSAWFGTFASDLSDLLLLLLHPLPFLSSLSLYLLEKKEVGDIYPKKSYIFRQDSCADNIDPCLPLKNLLCLTDFSSFGLDMQQNESQVPVEMSSWAGFLPVHK